MTSIKARTVKDRNRDSVYLLYKKLLKALDNPEKTSEHLFGACETQSLLAAYSDENEGINSLSINTMKTTAEVVIEDGGWKKLDELRMLLIRSRRHLDVKKVANKTKSRKDLHEEIRVLKNQLQQAHRGRTTLVRAYHDLVTVLRSATQNDERLKSRYIRHQNTYGEYLGINVLVTKKINE